ncbi:threonine--tRNA ligase [Acetivibrio sp. MSJd-27]|uniref:threonine--tRNA ligase n=1 Tax=Acetivibrio sp. MSJd-27 TaxID=2841523 RepID=UPI001C11658E|nr:threonine--tRNA ligase [Acetivibrio sp. MSJd-27]MBU5449721.1 threonine--tRNA ligase [Acetivibrio sp. MSJd-27]
MFKITLKDGSVKEYNQPLTVLELAKDISEGLARVALGALVNGQVAELSAELSEDCEVSILTFQDKEGKHIYWHTTSHILAQAVKRLYPEAKLAIGPAIDTGFYYDFDRDGGFDNDDLSKIEAEMKKIIKENIPVERFELPREEALKRVKEAGELYKEELINDLPKDAVISFYRQGDFTDLCAGPHLLRTGSVKAFKLTSVNGAYWRGSEKNKMLSRIYGTAFPKNSELTAYLEQVEEAKKRDHNKLGRELELFTTSDLIGQGLPIMLPKGAKILQVLQRFVEDTEAAHGWQLTKTPYMAKSDLYKLSGHWDHYQDGMFIMGDPEDKEVFALRPMTCPFQYQAYLNRGRSYRDLPLRYNETSTLFRNEASGEMHGLIRVRQFTISEGHLMCTPEQLEDEFKGCLELAIYMLKTLGLYEDVSYRFSKWDPDDREKYIGTPEQWDEAQGVMKKILEHLEIPYVEGIGEAAFYGPKLDIQIKNVHGKEDTLITIQIDQMLAEKFGMEYVDKDGIKKNPYIIHRTSIGCYERTLALLIEKYAGAFPTWLAPVQVKVLPIAEAHHGYAKQIGDILRSYGVRVETDLRNEKVGYKIREAQLEKIPYMLVVGDKEMEMDTVAVRSRKEGDKGTVSLEAFKAELLQEIAEKRI